MPEASPRAPRVGLLYDSVSANTGDVAIGIAGRQELARHGIDDVVVLDPFNPAMRGVDAVIVGGGELIRPLGDAFYDAFRTTGGAILNAVGVWQNADQLDYLSGYDFVSARSQAEAAVIRPFAPDVRVLPCTTTTLESETYHVDHIEPGERVVGVHVVPHTLSLCPGIVEIVNAIPHRKVFIPFTHYNYDESFMRALPFDMTNAVLLPRLEPLELHSVIGQMAYVVTSSLHATLFAYSQGVPFASAHQEKVVNYFGDRGLGRFVFASDDQLRRSLAEIDGGKVTFEDEVAADKQSVRAAYADYAEIIRRRATEQRTGARRRGAAVGQQAESDRRADHLRAEQREHVITNRDVTVHSLMYRAVSAEAEATHWKAEAERLSAVLQRYPHRMLLRGLRAVARLVLPVRLRRMLRRVAASPTHR